MNVTPGKCRTAQSKYYCLAQDFRKVEKILESQIAMAPWAAWPVSATNSNLWGGVPTWQVEFLHQNPLTTNDLQQPYGESNTLLTLTSTVEKMSLFLQVED